MLQGDQQAFESRAHAETITSRVGAVLLPVGVVLFVVSTAFFHPSEEHPMNDPAVFMEYAQDDGWVATHFVQWFAALFLIAGLVAVYFSLASRAETGAAVARFGFVAAVLTGTAFTMLQAVDGVALKWAVDVWARAPDDQRVAAFAAAQSLRWTEYALQSYSNILLGVTLILYATATALSTAYPRWLAWLAAGSGVAWTVHGGMVPYVGLFNSVPRLVAIVLLAGWSFVMAVLMWRRDEAVRSSSLETSRARPAKQTARLGASRSCGAARASHRSHHCIVHRHQTLYAFAMSRHELT